MIDMVIKYINYLVMNKIDTNKWQWMILRVLIVAIIVVSPIADQCHAQSNNDTIVIRYDKAKQTLRIECPSNNDVGICFKIDTSNEFSMTLKNNSRTDALKLPSSSNPQYLGLYNEYDYGRLPGFDSIGFGSIEFYYYDRMTFEVKNTKRCPSKIVVDSDEEEMEETEQEEPTTQKSGFSWWLIPAGILMICMILAGYLLLRKKLFHNKRRPLKKSEVASHDSSLEMVEEVSTELVRNLDFVRNSPENYYVLDMHKVFANTAVHNIFLHHTVVKKMYDFFKQSLESSEQTNETGCYFIGCWEYDGETRQVYNISVEDIVEPGDDLVPGEFSFNFGLKIGVKLFARLSELAKKTNRDFVHTVWMHSHPGLGLFLSSHDLLVQKQLDYSDAPGRLAAFVIDTNTPKWDLAIFTAKTDGSMNNKEDLKCGFFSLEQMYKWSLDAKVRYDDGHVVMTETADSSNSMENYFHHQWKTNHKGSRRTINAYYSKHAIYSLQDYMYENAGKQTIAGYALGTLEASGTVTNIVIDNCIANWHDNVIAILIVDAKVKDSDIIPRYVGDKPINCVIVLKSITEFIVLVRADSHESFPQLSEAEVCSLDSMKEWTKRKHIPK